MWTFHYGSIEQSTYLVNGDIPSQVEDTLYKIHGGILAKRFGMFQGMFNINGGKNDELPQLGMQNEGQSDETPIKFGEEMETTKQEWEYILRLVYNG